MSTEFLAFLPPPGDAISNYNRLAPSSDQPSNIPPHFIDAMTVRETVFVNEQSVPLSNEMDIDDRRSFHWIVFASVSSSASTPDGRRSSEGNRKAVGTVRLVPPPHKVHGKDEPGQGLTHGVLPKTQMYDGEEVYVKLGRLATVKAYRGLGLGKLLVTAALEWARTHPAEVMPHWNPAKQEAVGGEREERWKGLVLVHAQKNAEKVWARLGFVKDSELGEWDEEGIVHVAMWRRIEVVDK
ncbi:MAG: hypothetical protein M1824_001159 [Vezdaea acicularis]|nr:MAG: hypothetical protein M1824_001159 [Vezdaea acicularis]